jgi:hypothetical protein
MLPVAMQHSVTSGSWSPAPTRPTTLRGCPKKLITMSAACRSDGADVEMVDAEPDWNVVEPAWQVIVLVVLGWSGAWHRRRGY